MSFLKKFVGKLSETLNIASNAIKDVIKENNQYLDAELEVSKESKEGIAALKAYAETESEGLGTAIGTLAETFEKIEEARENKVVQLREEFIDPLDGLLREYEIQQTELREAEKAKDELEKAEKKLSKLKTKASSKPLKAGVMENAEAQVSLAKKTYDKEAEEAKVQGEAFNKKKLEILQEVLKKMVEIEITYHQGIIDQIGDVKVKAEAINIEEEAKIPEPEGEDEEPVESDE